jgi:hypothetical protein
MKTKPLVLLTLALLRSFFTPANADLKDDLVAHWSFDDCTAKDNSGNGHDGAINGNPQCVDGVKGKAFSFDGVSDFISASANNFPTGARTVAILFKPNTDNNHPVMFGYGGGVDCGTSWFMGLNLATNPNRYYFGSHCEINALVNDYNVQDVIGKWTQMIVITSQNGTEMYINGVKVASNTIFVSNTFTENKDFSIGVNSSSHGITPYTDINSGYFNGKIDDLRIYNRALSEPEITELYKNPTEKTFKPIYSLSQSLDSIFNAIDGSEQMDGTVFGQCVYGGYCARPTQKGALNGVNYMVDSGTPVYAICDGVVKDFTKGGDIKTRYTVINHSNCGGVKGGLFAYYRHIDPAQNIKKGALIKAGDLIGNVATWKNNNHLQLSFSTKLLSNLTGYTELKTITKADCSKTAVEQRRKTLNATGWLDPIEIGMKSGWNSVLLKGGISKTGCNATEQLYEPAPLGNTLSYSPWK